MGNKMPPRDPNDDDDEEDEEDEDEDLEPPVVFRETARLSHARLAARLIHRVEPPQDPLDAARASLDDAVPVLTGDPMTTKDFVQENAERESLEQLSDGELLRKAAREVLIAVCVAH
jgi:hypothetical protein